MNKTTYDYLIDQDANCIFIKHYGPITKESVVARGEGVAVDCNYRENLNRLIDVRGCDVNLGPDDMSFIASMMRKSEAKHGSYTEILLVDSLLAHGVVRMMMSFVGQKDISYMILHTTDPDIEQKLYASLGLPNGYPLPDIIQLSSPELSQKNA